MKKTALVSAIAAVFAIGTASASERPPNNIGCGLGSIAFEGQSGVAPQVLGATTNGTSGNQTFGISSGTSGCAGGGEVQRPDKVAMFIGPNLNRLAQDMSRGEGETLASLAEVVGVEEQDRPAFYRAMQRNFARIMPSENVTVGEVLVSMNAILAEDEVLSRYVVS
jgi:hypothetical protein